MLSTKEILRRYITFFKEKGHAQIANSPLVLANDPTTLFTSSGMQPLVPYLLGEVHPSGTRLVNAQNCIRSQDIEEVGDNRHTTFFRMLGNWSLGDPASPGSASQGGYFKKEQLPWFFEFLTSNEEGLDLDPKKLYVTVFSGSEDVARDTESIKIWEEIFKKQNMDSKFVDLAKDAEEKGMQGGRIFAYDVKKNWWSRSGVPSNMPIGEPGGPDSEVFYDFGTKHDSAFGKECHPNCDCGRFMEIGNSVFMQYIRTGKRFEELPQQNVDFGGGLERLAAANNNNPDVFTTDLYKEVIAAIETTTKQSYTDEKYTPAMRVTADHMKAAVFLIADGVLPSNKEQGYILRRLLRRAAVKMYQMDVKLDDKTFAAITDEIIRIEEQIDEKLKFQNHAALVTQVVTDEIERFSKSLEKGLKEVAKNIDHIDDIAFDIYQSHGFPYELLEEIVKEKGASLNKKAFEKAKKEHREKSRSASAGKFRGGLADHEERTIMGHTATHLMHQALRDVLGKHIHQTGSNITVERVRFDFNYEKKLTDEEITTVEKMVNEKILENLPVHFELIPTVDAQKIGAIGLFMDTYGDKSKIYFIGGDTTHPDTAYSIEFCGGPHVDFTGKVKSFKIIKQENLGKSQRRVYAVIG